MAQLLPYSLPSTRQAACPESEEPPDRSRSTCHTRCSVTVRHKVLTGAPGACSCEELRKPAPDRTARAVKRAAPSGNGPTSRCKHSARFSASNQVRGDRVTGQRFTGEMTPGGGENRPAISADRGRRLKSPAEATQIRANLVLAAVSSQQIDHLAWIEERQVTVAHAIEEHRNIHDHIPDPIPSRANPVHDIPDDGREIPGDIPVSEHRGIARIPQRTTEHAPAIASRAALATPAADLLAVDPVPGPQPDIACGVPERRLERHDLRPLAGDPLRLPFARRGAASRARGTRRRAASARRAHSVVVTARAGGLVCWRERDDPGRRR